MAGPDVPTSQLNRVTITLAYTVVSLLTMGYVLVLGSAQNVIQLALTALLVIFFGLPHGALDVELATSLRLIKSRSSGAVFFAGYLLLTLGGIALWLWWPVLALSIFLVISAYHFSDDWLVALGRPASLALGTMVLGLSAISHPDLVASLFSLLLVSANQATILTTLLRYAAGAGLVVLVLVLVRKQCWSWPLMMEIGVLISSAVILPPLLYFVIYFCLIHAQRHMLDCARFLSLPLPHCYQRSVPMVLLTLVLAAISYYFFGSSDFSREMVRWLFIGLFGLTIPHVAIIAYWNRTSPQYNN